MAFLREPTIIARGERWSVGYFSTETDATWKDMDAGVQAKFQAKFDMLALNGRLHAPAMKKISGTEAWEVELKGKTGSERAYCMQVGIEKRWLITHFGVTDHSKGQTQAAAGRAEQIFEEYMEFLDETK